MESHPAERTRFGPHSAHGFAAPENFINNLTNILTQVEEETDTALTAVAEEINSDVGHLESHLTDLHSKAEKRLNTEIGALSEYLVAPSRFFVKVEDDLSKIQHYLQAKPRHFPSPTAPNTLS